MHAQCLGIDLTFDFVHQLFQCPAPASPPPFWPARRHQQRFRLNHTLDEKLNMCFSPQATEATNVHVTLQDDDHERHVPYLPIMDTTAKNCSGDSAREEAAAVAEAAVSSEPPKSQQRRQLQLDEEQQQQQKAKSERARARWSILRSALLSSANAASSTNAVSNTNCRNTNGGGDNDANESNAREVNSASIHRFAGFQLLDRRVVNVEEEKRWQSSASAVSTCRNNSSNHNGDKNGVGADDEDESKDHYEFAEYTIQVQLPPVTTIDEDDTKTGTNNKTAVRVRTRERRHTKKQRVDLRGLLSHRLHGVDNTGQSCVWDSESTLTYCLFAGDDGSNDSSDTVEEKERMNFNIN